MRLTKPLLNTYKSNKVRIHLQRFLTCSTPEVTLLCTVFLRGYWRLDTLGMGMYTNSVWVCTQTQCGYVHKLSVGMYTNSVWVCTQTQYGYVHKLSMGMYTNSVWVCTQLSMGMYTNSVWVCTQTQYGYVHKLSMGLYTNSVWLLRSRPVCGDDKSTLQTDWHSE